MPVLLPFLLWPLGEIAVFAIVGGEIGALNTILLVILSAVAGVAILRRQGLAALTALRPDAAGGPPPAGAVLDGLAVAFAGLLLLLPGFLSDIIGLCLLVPGIRQNIAAWLSQRFVRAGGQAHYSSGVHRPPPAGQGVDGEVIDVEFVDVSPPTADPARRLDNRG